MKSEATLVPAFLLFAMIAPAQTARQGTRQAIAQTEFESPMLLETVFVMADSGKRTATEWQTSEEYPKLSKFRVDGVSLDELSFRYNNTLSGSHFYRARVLLKNRPGHDKIVEVRLELFDGDDVLSWAKFDPVQVKEKKSREIETTLAVPLAVIEKTPAAQLRIVVAAEDD